MKITIAEPVLENELEQFTPMVATETRAKLKEMFLDKAPEEEEVPDAPIPKEELKALKEQMYSACDALMKEQSDTYPEYHSVRVLGVAAEAAGITGETVPTRHDSYKIEFAFQWAKGYIFKNKLTSPEEFPVLSLGALKWPSSTNGYLDNVLRHYLYVKQNRLLPNLKESLPDALLRIHRPHYAEQEMYYTFNGVNYRCEVSRTNDYYGIVYTEEGTSWFAGFLGLDDVLKLRFRRMRLGAAVKEMTGSDTLAKKAADIRSVQGYDLVLHPNDRPFGVEYVRIKEEGGPDSCMTHKAYNYSAPYGVHPCDVYSLAHYGQGDNGLVLIEAQQSGTPVGRGILDVNSSEIVRWYGEHKVLVLLRSTFSISDDASLDGVQLALIQDSSKFAAPYLDGCQSAELEDDCLFIRYNGSIEMDDTSGYQYSADTKCCCLSGYRYPEDELVYQEISETWYHPDHEDDGYLCPITQEYLPRSYMSYRVVEGEEDVLVSDAVALGHHDPFGWTYLGDNVGWTENENDWYYDEETEQYYNEDDYNELLSERQEQEEEDAA